MRKIINPIVSYEYGSTPVNGFAKIDFENGKLSISGVIGPRRNGNCIGSAGQCIDEIRRGEPAELWTREMVDKFCDIWEAWHLNDMRPYCVHQKNLGWDKLSSKKVTLYHYRLKREIIKEQEQAKSAAIKCLKSGETFTPTGKQTRLANLPYSITLPRETNQTENEYYEPKKPLYNGDSGFTEEKMLGWLYEKDHPEGLLCKPCPVCGYKYGTSCFKEEVPQDVLDWLFSLPNSEVVPAWV